MGLATLRTVLAHGGRACRDCTRVFDSLCCQIGNLAVDRRVAGGQTMWWQCAQEDAPQMLPYETGQRGSTEVRIEG